LLWNPYFGMTTTKRGLFFFRGGLCCFEIKLIHLLCRCLRVFPQSVGELL
jgi:hypothetical protein